MRFSAFAPLALLVLGALVKAQDEFAEEAPAKRQSVTEILLGSVKAKAVIPNNQDPSDGSNWPDTTTDTPTLVPLGTTITGIRYSGSGCPTRTVIPGIDPTFRVISLKFTRFDLKLDEFTRARRARKTCNIRIALRTPSGYAFSANSFAVDGDLFLSGANAQATFTSVAWLANIPQAKAIGITNLDTTVLGVAGTFFGEDSKDVASGHVDVPKGITYVNGAVEEAQQTPVLTVFRNPWWSACPPNHGPIPLGFRFERNQIAIDFSVQLQRLNYAARAYISANSATAKFEKGILLDWQQCAAAFN